MADDLIAVRPGVMCVAAEALAALTLPNGDSRTHERAPRAQDFSVATAGGCIDIPSGARVTVQQAFENTSIVTFGGTGPLVVPNIDFQPTTTTVPGPYAGPNVIGPAPQGYVVTQHIPTESADGQALEMLEDSRITPPLRRQMWRVSDDPASVLGQTPLAQALAQQPLLPARLRLVTATGETLAFKPLSEPLATIQPAPLHGLPAPAFLLTVDYSGRLGGYSGPATQILVPATQQLQPVEYVSATGPGDTIILPQTGKAAWKIVGPVAGGTEAILAVSSQPDQHGQFTTSYRTYRFSDGHWMLTTRLQSGPWENDVFPPLDAFP